MTERTAAPDSPLVTALRTYEQADPDGVMVNNVSRQALEEAAERVEMLEDVLELLGVAPDNWFSLYQVVAERTAVSESAPSEGYPGIAHDFEKMRSALEYIARLPNDYPVSAIASRARDAIKNAAPQVAQAAMPATPRAALPQDASVTTPAAASIGEVDTDCYMPGECGTPPNTDAQDAARYRWAKPILSGDGDAQALALAAQLARGLDGDAAIDAAMKSQSERPSL